MAKEEKKETSLYPRINKYILNENMDGNGPNSEELAYTKKQEKPLILETKPDKSFDSKKSSKIGPVKNNDVVKYACILAVDYLIGELLHQCAGQK